MEKQFEMSSETGSYYTDCDNVSAIGNYYATIAAAAAANVSSTSPSSTSSCGQGSHRYLYNNGNGSKRWNMNECDQENCTSSQPSMYGIFPTNPNRPQWNYGSYPVYPCGDTQVNTITSNNAQSNQHTDNNDRLIHQAKYYHQSGLSCYCCIL